MKFVSDALFDGRRIRALTLVDNYTPEALAIVVDSVIRGKHVVDAVGAVAARRGAPCLIRVDNGPESDSKVLDRSAYERGVTLDISRPGKPTDNAFVESFDERLRDECLGEDCSPASILVASSHQPGMRACCTLRSAICSASGCLSY